MELIEKRLSAQDQALQQSTKTQLPPQSVRHNSSPQPKSGGIGLGGGGEGKLLGRPKRIFMHHQHRTSFMTFGQHLKDCPVSPDKVPVVMEFCVEMVEKHGLTVEGIYRKPGCVATINSLSAQIDRGNYAFDGQDIHVVASLMKKFLKELPDALLPYHMYQDLVACARLRDEETKLSTLKDLVYHLPTAHYHTLKFLMCHLGKVVAHSQQNKMTLQNMALVFGHILMRGSIFDDLLANMTAVYTIMELLCKRCEYLCSTDLCAEEVEKFFVEQEDIPSQYALSFESDSLLLSLLGCREMATGDTGSLTDLSDMKLSSECGKSELGILKDQPKSHFYRYPEVPEPHNNLCQWEDCSVQCSHLEELVDHVNHVHVYRDSKEFICKWVGCPRKRDPFRRQHKLLVHLRRHTGERPHKCSYKGCSKAYTRLTNLKAHLLTHAGERYVCKYAGCDKAFPSISACANHMSREHSDEKPYACLHPGCTERYSDAGMRWSHMQQCPLNKKVINVAVVEQKDKASSDISTNEACASSAPTRSSVSAITVSRPKNTWKPSLTFDPSLTNRSLSGDIGYYTGGSNITGDSQGYASSHYSGKGFSSERSVAAVPPHIQRQMSMRQAGVEMEFQDWGIMELSSGQTDL